jgi:hypothetical protein
MFAMQHYHLREKHNAATVAVELYSLSGDADMPSVVKSTFLGFALVVGGTLAAQAQSVASLPPNGGSAPATVQSAVTQPYGSRESFYPKPGGSQFFKEQHYQAPSDYTVNKAAHPYSTSIGPSPGSHSSGRDVHYQATAADSASSAHPYTAGIGPKPN